MNLDKRLSELLRKYHNGTITPEEDLQLEFLILEQMEQFVFNHNDEVEEEEEEENFTTLPRLSIEEYLILEEWKREREFLLDTETFNTFDRTEADPDAKAAWQKFQERMYPPLHQTHTIPQSTSTPKHRSYRYLSIVASIVAIFALAFWINSYFLPFAKPTIYYADSGIREIYLPDSSFVVINEGSQLVVNPRFKRQRHVSMKGEIYFEITKDPKKPFIITHGDLTTEVKGTSFTIRDYPQLDQNAVIVNTGVVQVSASRQGLATLMPNQQLIYHKSSRRYSQNTVQAENYTAWREGRIILQNANEKELALRLMQVFNKELRIQNHALGHNVCINSEFNTETQLDDWIKSIAMAHGVEYEIRDDAVIFKK